MTGQQAAGQSTSNVSKPDQDDVASTHILDVQRSWERHKVEYKQIHKMQKLFDLDGLSRVLETMRRHLHAPDMQGAGCVVLAELAVKDPALREQIVSSGAIQTVLTAMRINLENKWQQETGCDFLSVMATAENGVTIIAEHGGVDAAIIAMRVHSDYDGVLRAACSAIRSVAGHGTDKKAIVVDDGGVVAVVKAMRAHPSSSSLIATACGALGALAWRNKESKVAVAKAGGIETIIVGMRTNRPSPDVQENACKALRSIMGNSTEYRNRIARAGGIESIVAGVGAHKFVPLVAQEGSLLLQGLAAGHPQHQQSIAQAGGISVMAEALRNQPYVSPQTVGGAIQNLTGKDTKQGLCETDFAFHKPAHPRPLTRPASPASLSQTTFGNSMASPSAQPTSVLVSCSVTEIAGATLAPLNRPQSATVVTRTATANSLNRPVHNNSKRPFSAGPQRFVVTNVEKMVGAKADRHECQLLSDMAGLRPVPKKQRPASSPGQRRWQTHKLTTYDHHDLRRQTFMRQQSSADCKVAEKLGDTLASWDTDIALDPRKRLTKIRTESEGSRIRTESEGSIKTKQSLKGLKASLSFIHAANKLH